MNKKAALGAVAVLLGTLYGGTTWYLGGRAQSSYQQALEEARTLLGAGAVVSHNYERGFFTSHAQVVMQWTLPAAEGADAAAAAPAQTLRLTLGSTLRHGPVVGARLAAAVVDTHLEFEGLDDNIRQLFAKTSAPTLTTVHHFTGGNDLTLELPAGELAEGDNLVRWQALRYQMALNADRSVLRGDMVWPEFTLRVHDDGLAGAEDDAEDTEGTAAREPSNITVVLQGTRGQFDVRLEDGLWLLTPGWSKARIDTVSVLQQPVGGAEKTLATLQDMGFDAKIERTGELLGWTASMQTKGSIGPVGFDALGLNEKVSRIDVEAVHMLQKALISAYRSEASSAAGLVQEDALGQLLVKAAPRLLAGLPSYAMEVKATLDGKEGSLLYGAQIKTAPEQALVEAQGWGAALLKSSVLNASLRLPKNWIPLIAKSMGKDAPKEDDINTMLGFAQAQGYLTQEADSIVSSVQMDEGKLLLNGKAMELPSLGGQD